MRTFDYAKATTPAQAVSTASGEGERFYLAGGTTLLDLVKLDIMQPGQLVDINHLALKQIESLPDGRLRIGALSAIRRWPVILWSGSATRSCR